MTIRYSWGVEDDPAGQLDPWELREIGKVGETRMEIFLLEFV